MKNAQRRTAYRTTAPLGLGLGLLLAACSTTPPTPTTPLAPAVGTSLRQCDTLASQFRFDQATIDSAAPVAAGGLMLAGQPVAAHCLVKGQMHKRKGSDGRDYAIAFEMRLPQAWNGRFYHQGNGGLDGAVRPAEGALGGGPTTGALVQGFAVISSDAGHTGAQTAVFGLEPQARLDYGYQAVAKLTPMAKSLIASAYGKGPDRSYIGGCSNGGRHAMVAASRLGDQYDGYLIGAPGYRLPNAALAQLWGAQRWTPLATPGATVKHPLNPNANIPDLGSALTAPERQTVAQAILGRCDALDGLKDGLVQATQACQAAFDVARDVPTCAGARNGSCLTPAQKTTLAQVMAGGKATNGQSIYSAFPYDAGIAGSNWATWKFINSVALDPLSVGTIFTAPPAAPADIASANIDVLLPAISATSATYPESGLALMSPPGNGNPSNLAPLRARGAKMVLYHGVSDAIFSAEDTRQWFERLNKAQGGKASDFARYFPVPGMNHCSGGPTADQFDLLGPLVKWVEQGVAPQAVTASARGAGNAGGVNAELPAEWAANRSRPLCAYPSVATYNGSGPIESASSFSCR
ncbi:tannase/feruloyl esterase family alpha/beta hydrolase [Hydrogenophaga sp.]|uniref:tannase/feruloyl esterase family alpha/beta hydrolase n=1 Tax=Hydrogenophaga sp. TaxID=1904254 RepID=UPI00271B9066|nr:tannase/feruloyl esterase family alpha/beta hydrolase [Hydrogenophaga sp.]MDO9438708.1 tannase/feruloyl esterase family alpha/beta hydrolase [Hydrogenophaga sp.]